MPKARAEQFTRILLRRTVLPAIVCHEAGSAYPLNPRIERMLLLVSSEKIKEC